MQTNETIISLCTVGRSLACLERRELSSSAKFACSCVFTVSLTELGLHACLTNIRALAEVPKTLENDVLLLEGNYSYENKKQLTSTHRKEDIFILVSDNHSSMFLN